MATPLKPRSRLWLLSSWQFFESNMKKWKTFQHETLMGLEVQPINVESALIAVTQMVAILDLTQVHPRLLTHVSKDDYLIITCLITGTGERTKIEWKSYDTKIGLVPCSLSWFSPWKHHTNCRQFSYQIYWENNKHKTIKMIWMALAEKIMST